MSVLEDRRGSAADIGARLDALPSSAALWRIVALISYGGFFEIYDIGLTGPLSLALNHAGVFHEGKYGMFGFADQATFVAATFAGLWAGTVAFSAIADRFGRRPIFALALVWYGIGALAMGLQNRPLTIDLWRFVASIGVGVQLVGIDCYLAELTPTPVRGRAFSVSTAIQFIGAPVVAILAAVLAQRTFLGLAGWRWLCFAPAIGVAGVWWVWRAVPESPRWLASWGRLEDASRALARLAGGRDPPSIQAGASPGRCAASLPEQVAIAAGRFAELWRPPTRARVVMMIVFHLFQAVGFFGFSNWLPTLLVAKGVTVTRSLTYGAAIALTLPLSPLVYAFIADRAERKWQIVAGALLVAIFGLTFTALGAVAPATLFIVVGVGLAAANSLMSYGFHAYQSEIFPTPLRARAVGFVYSFSRLSALGSGYLIAFTLARFGADGVFVLIGAAMVVAAGAVGLFGPRTTRRAVEIIAPGPTQPPYATRSG